VLIVYAIKQKFVFGQKGEVMKIDNKSNIIFLMVMFLHNSISLSQPRNIEIQGWNIISLQDALINVRKIIDNFPLNNVEATQTYEEKQSYTLVKCAKVLYDNARQQILSALQEIDRRKYYWQYQKDHQWRYFFTKNPLKWITGETQEVEINNNIERLESCQGELYVLLGLVAESGNVYDQNFKTSFVSDYKKGDEWIDNLLDLLSRIKTPPVQETRAFFVRAMQLKLKLERVNYFKEDILSDINETKIPSRFAQDWLKYGTLGLTLGYGYNLGGVEKLKKSFDYVTRELGEYIVDPVKKLAEEVFVGEDKSNARNEKIIKALSKTNQTTLELAKEFVVDKSKKYGIMNAAEINAGIDIGDYEAFQKFLETIANQEAIETSLWHPFKTVEKAGKFATSQADYAHGLILFGQLLGFASTEDLQKFVLDFITQQQKQFAGVSKLVLLTPALFSGLLAYTGYQKLTTKDYRRLRHALLEINSLFVDQSKPLDDERYGKMIYLLYNLKRQVKKEVSQKRNLQANFLQDLENIESKEFDVAAKRRIIDDMFKKYSFLGTF
jgi:hypothetical protein